MFYFQDILGLNLNPNIGYPNNGFSQIPSTT
jgi:hypothetical protein